MRKLTLLPDGPALPWTGERFIPGLAGEIEFEHVHRYLFAAQFCEGKRVLDVASGEGYGSNLLASVAAQVFGVDVAQEAVDHATGKYTADNLKFVVGAAQKLPLSDHSVDVVVSFETLEHIDQQRTFFEEIKRILIPGGLMIMSTPDKNVYMADEHNEFHVHELDLAEFQALIGDYFPSQAIGRQKALAGSVILPNAPGGVELEVFGRPDRTTFEASPLPREAAYFVAVASEAALPTIRWGLLDDAQYLRQLQVRLENTQLWVAYVNGIAEADTEIISPCLYSHADGDAFSEDTAVRQLIKLKAEPQTCILQTPAHETGVAAIRLDLTDANRTFVLRGLAVETLTGEILFRWDGGAEFLNAGVRMQATPVDGGVRVECGPDPQLSLPLPPDMGKAHALRVVLSLSKEPSAIESLPQVQEALDAVAALDASVKGQIDILGRKLDAGGDIANKRASLLEARMSKLVELGEGRGEADGQLSRQIANVQDRVQADLAALRGSILSGEVAREDLAQDVRALRDSIAESNVRRAAEQAVLSERLENITTSIAPLAEISGGLIDRQTSLDARQGEALTAIQATHNQVLRLSASQAILDKRLDVISEGAAAASTALAEQVASLKGELQESSSQSSQALIDLKRRLAMSQDSNADVIQGLQNNLAAYVSRTVSELENGLRAELSVLSTRLGDAAETNRLLLDASIQKARLEILQREIGAEGGGLQESLAAIARLKANERRASDVLEEIYRSSSWRITAPIRTLKTFFATGRLPRAPARPEGPGAQQAERQIVHTPTGPDVESPAEIGHQAMVHRAPVIEPIDPTPITTQPPLANPAVKLVAFYLPQFHPIPENDAWWGKGFTEWTNVTRATPQFDGHYQPHLPSDLGFYDLRVPVVQEKQVELAKLYGVGAFCFYFYWFAGKRLLETPIEQFADNPNIDFPFCLCWANENWSRRWDGLDTEILIGQNHSPEDDIAFITYVSRYLKHRNNIRIEGKPLLVIYRPNLLPDPKATAERWRAWCRANDVGEIYLAYVQSFEVTDPAEYGFDAAVEFPPNNTAPPIITSEMEHVNPDFSGVVYDYRIYPERSESYAKPSYKLFRGVFPSWDNEARRRGRGSMWAYATPARYRKWLENAARDTVSRLPNPDERLVFVNAWNEWAEGAHLEPDQRYGYAWLQATRDGLEAVSNTLPRSRLGLVTHDAYTHGAQFLALNIGRRMVDRFGVTLDVVALGEGPLTEDFARLGEFHSLAGLPHDGVEAQALAQKLKAKGVEAVLCSTTVSGIFLGVLHKAGLRTVCLVHELAGVISSYKLERHASAIAAQADEVVFPGPRVRASFETFARPPKDRSRLMPQGSFRKGPRSLAAKAAAATRLRERLKVPPTAKIVLGVGYGDSRKGIDIFVAAGERVMAENEEAVFVWLGLLEHTIEPEIRERVAASNYSQRFVFPGFDTDNDDYYAGADVYAMTSREDPFPMVVLEALQAGTPVVGFDGAGDFDVLLNGGGGILVSPIDAAPMAEGLLSLLGDEARRAALGGGGRELVDFNYAFDRYVLDLVKLLKPGVQRVSVVVPNYNYARFMDARLRTIDTQTAPPYEIIVLDDKSNDDSVAVIRSILPTLETPACLVANATNSGSVFRQWRKGVELAGGDLIWIAEADDLAAPGFLETVLKGFEDPAVVMSFVQSKQIGQDGEVLANDYLDYVADVDPTRWRESYVADGEEEIRTALAIKNTIPNASGVVFRRGALAKVLAEDFDEIAARRVAGDWVAYIKLLQQGKLAFNAQSLNLHRRHSGSVTLGSFDAGQLKEIVSVQRLARRVANVPSDVAARADAYAQALYVQFGLATTERAYWSDDPAFAEVLVDSDADGRRKSSAAKGKQGRA